MASTPPSLTEKELEDAEKTTATAAAGGASEDAATSDTAAEAQGDLSEPAVYSLVDMHLVAEIITTVAALQHRLFDQQEYGAHRGNSWLWQATSGAPQLQALTALRAAMMTPTVPTADPLCCMGALLCQTLLIHRNGGSGDEQYQQSLVDAGSGAVLGVLSRPARVVVTAESDNDSLVSVAYLHEMLPSDGLVVLPHDGKVAGGVAATNWQLTVRTALRLYTPP